MARLDGKAPSSRALGCRETPVLPDGLWRRDPGERRTPLRLLDRHVAIARRKTGVFRRPTAPRDADSVRTQHALPRPFALSRRRLKPAKSRAGATNYGVGKRLTCAATTCQPSSVLNQVWLCRPVPVGRLNSVLA